MISRFLFGFFVLFPGVLAAQPGGFISIQKSNVTGYTLISSNQYDGKSLWGYMNGGADLYLEYGFVGLLVEEINYKGISIKCEIYKMDDPLSAFGIFSVQRHKCEKSGEYKTIHCLNNYQVQIVKGDYYLSIINQTGDAGAQAASLEIARQLDNQIEAKEIVFPDHPFFKNKTDRLIYLKGEISLSNVYPQALSYLDEVAGYTMWMLPSEGKEGPIVTMIQFKGNDGLKGYASFAFPGMNFETSGIRKLKSGGALMSKKLNENTVLQAEGKVDKATKKLLAFDTIK